MKRTHLFINNIKKYIEKKLYKKYLVNNDQNNMYLIEKIIYNENCRLVALFKEFLIYDDNYEFMKKYYIKNNSIRKLNKYLEYYEKYSIIYPNYSILPESKYIYKNIHKKQKIIDKLHNIESMEKESKKENNKFQENKNLIGENNNDKNVFNSNTYNSILKNSENECLSIFGLINNKDEENDKSTSSINNILKTIEKNEKEPIKARNNFKTKNEYMIKPFSSIKKKINKNKYKLKVNTNNTSNNNSNTILNTTKSNKLNINNLNESDASIYKGNKLNEDKLLFKKCESKIMLFRNSNILNIIKKNTIYPLKSTLSKRNMTKPIIQYNTLRKIITNKTSFQKEHNHIIKHIYNKINKNKVIKINENKYKIKNCHTLNNTNNKNIKSYLYNKNKFASEDLKKSFSEKKLNIKKKVLTINNVNIQNNEQNLKKLKINRNKSYIKKNISNFRDITLKRSIFTSSLLKKKKNIFSNIKKSIKKDTDKKYNTITHSKNDLNKKYNLNNSLSVKVLNNNKFNDKNFMNDKKKSYNTIIKKDRNIRCKKIFIYKKLFDSSKYTKNVLNNKKYFKNIIIKTKAKLTINNIFLNTSNNVCTSQNKINNNYNNSNEKFKIVKTISGNKSQIKRKLKI